MFRSILPPSTCRFPTVFETLTMANRTDVSLLEMVGIMLTGLGEIESIPLVYGNLLHGCFRGIVQQFQGSRAL
jgi:hypothetical protein